MRRLAGSLIFVIAALSVIYSASWMLLVYKSEAQNSIKTSKGVFGVSIVASKTPSPIPIASPTQTPTPTPKPTLSPTQKPEQETAGKEAIGKNSAEDSKSYILDKINAYRASKDLSAASSNEETCSFAKTRASEIASSFDHNGFTQRMNSKSLPYPNYSLVTENIAMTSNYMDVVDIWINSASHAKNMQEDTPFICVEQNGDYYAYEGWRP